MKTQPPVFQGNAIDGANLVRQSDWQYFCDVDAATGIHKMALALCPNAKLIDANDMWFGGSLIYTNERIKAFSIVGSIPVGTGAATDFLAVFESAAWLLDRLTTPDGDVDYDGDRSQPGAVGGGVLKFRTIGNDTAELYWGK
jgi:hypothetical protein